MDHSIEKVQEERDTLGLLIDGEVKVSFFGYPYPLIEPVVQSDALDLASVADIGCMKLSAIVSRATNKDYIDLYYITHKIPLRDLMVRARQKFVDFDEILILKSIVYFDDIYEEPLLFQKGHEVSLSTIKKFFEGAVKEITEAQILP
ncbi:MAG: nucleotidyl transferase AbiEii/AbiGii toxin family protein [Minisyncoccota bacterium]